MLVFYKIFNKIEKVVKMEAQIKIPDSQLFYEININLSTIKSLLIFLELGLNNQIVIEDNDLSNVTTLLKEMVEKTIINFDKIETELRI